MLTESQFYADYQLYLARNEIDELYIIYKNISSEANLKRSQYYSALAKVIEGIRYQFIINMSHFCPRKDQSQLDHLRTQLQTILATREVCYMNNDMLYQGPRFLGIPFGLLGYAICIRSGNTDVFIALVKKKSS